MAMQTQPPIIGIDVAKAELVIHRHDENRLLFIENTPNAIRKWLKGLPESCDIALEATSTYHMDVTELAHAQGHRLYVVDGYRLSKYREGTGGRAKTDSTDAQLLSRYLLKEKDDLRRWSPPPKGYRELQSLLRRRAALVKHRTALHLSLSGEPLLKGALQDLLKHMDRLDSLIQKRLREIIQSSHLQAQVKRCQAIHGVGEISATALVMAYLRGNFKNSDAFIAFLGMDIRVRNSGTLKGKGKLTKQGDAEVRRLMHCAAMSASHHPQWRDFYQRYLDRGFAKTQALVILARKLIRVAFSLMRHETDYCPERAR